MTTSEFSNEFDILYNNITSNQAPGLDDYEKSVLLTEAQEFIVKSLYTGSFTGESFEKTEQLRRSLDSLVRTDYNSTEIPYVPNPDIKKLCSKSHLFLLPTDLWFITYESVIFEDDSTCTDNVPVSVVPMKQDEWNRAKGNPFRCPNKRKVIRLDGGNGISELISDYPIKQYIVRYIRRPSPIILTDLEEDNLSINGISTKTKCELNTVLHRVILEKAVDFASRIYSASK